jgi:CDP-diacylglycerol--serine O-phosphatidyltransferase
MKIKQNIPNFLTCCNLLCGCFAIVQVFEGNLNWAAYLVGIAAVFDFFDGFTARILKVSSPIGKDLDSLADMVTFGVVPGVIMYKLIFLVYLNANISVSFELIEKKLYLCYVAFLIPVFSAIRLAKFNNDTRQSESFIGLPTPANAIFVASLVLLSKDYSGRFTPEILCLLTVLLSLLLIAPMPLFALKFKSFGFKGNEIRYFFIGLSLVLLISLQLVGIPLIIILYVFLSLINNGLRRRKAIS